VMIVLEQPLIMASDSSAIIGENRKR
jgi:hypothetical protein